MQPSLITPLRSLPWLRIILFTILLGWYGFFLAQQINPITTDIGRHVQNGALIIDHMFSGTMRAVLTTNFYSYTNPDYPFLNHHWLSGVIVALIERVSGLYGVSLFFILISLITFAIFFRISEHTAGLFLSFALSLFLIPLIAERIDIRPEAFSYLLIAVFFAMLLRVKEKPETWRTLFFLPFLEIIWVNLHIYFFFGLFLPAVFLADEIKTLIFMRHHRKETFTHAMRLLMICFLTFCAALVNPAIWRGILYPLTIFHNYGYLIVENQSLWFLERIGFLLPNFLIFKITLVILAASFMFLFAMRPKACSFINAFLALTVSVMAFLAIRNFTLFGLFALPIIAIHIRGIIPQKMKHDLDVFYPGFFLCFGLIMIGSIALNYSRIVKQYALFGVGLVKGANQSAQFFLDNHIRGPLFNNYDIGSYLIYHLYPQERVFVDNRPEAYPDSFFANIYIPMQQDETIWQQEQEAYHINAIFFSHRDYTPWAQKFLIARVKDPQWAAVFADDYAIIFLRRNEINAALIKQFEIPKEQFSLKR